MFHMGTERELGIRLHNYVLVEPPMHTSSTVHPTYITVLGMCEYTLYGNFTAHFMHDLCHHKTVYCV